MKNEECFRHCSTAKHFPLHRTQENTDPDTHTHTHTLRDSRKGIYAWRSKFTDHDSMVACSTRPGGSPPEAPARPPPAPPAPTPPRAARAPLRCAAPTLSPRAAGRPRAWLFTKLLYAGIIHRVMVHVSGGACGGNSRSWWQRRPASSLRATTSSCSPSTPPSTRRTTRCWPSRTRSGPRSSSSISPFLVGPLAHHHAQVRGVHSDVAVADAHLCPRHRRCVRTFCGERNSPHLTSSVICACDLCLQEAPGARLPHGRLGL